MLTKDTEDKMTEEEVQAYNQEHKREVAILYSNRALCNLQMNGAQLSYEDATSATCFDGGYVKGYWRLGQACVALGLLKEGLEAFEKASALEGDNKALRKEVAKVEKLLVEEEVRRKEEEERGDVVEEEKEVKKEVKKQVIPLTKPAKTTTTTSTNTTTTSNNKTTKGSEPIRGYKIIGDKKTSYFHHEQTEEEKKLIGDIAPKRIDPNTTTTPNNNNNTDSTTPQRNDSINTTTNTSAWNKAGTWEEKDVTPWAISTLTKTLMDKCHYTLPPSSPDPNATVRVTKITKLIGSSSTTTPSGNGGDKAQTLSHASVATVRGKKRYIFEFTICLHWTLTFGNGVDTCSGTLAFDDVDGTHEMGEGYDIGEFTVVEDGGVGAGGLVDARFLLERFVKNGGLRNVVEGVLDEWICMFRDTY